MLGTTTLGILVCQFIGNLSQLESTQEKVKFDPIQQITYWIPTMSKAMYNENQQYIIFTFVPTDHQEVHKLKYDIS